MQKVLNQQLLNICVTGACGMVAYSLIPLLCSGRAFCCKDVKINLRLLDIEQALPGLKGLVMEL